ncbi:unnamed protein product [Rhizoctonia solani]|uniref:Uncharacterized protein n=1 Tax=Rhizoctonia solani TaxID=456999 RepID=A0A8H3AF03_9AGAM|nr:unnamed protein product [Rhizoctonia solani]
MGSIPGRSAQHEATITIKMLRIVIQSQSAGAQIFLATASLNGAARTLTSCDRDGFDSHLCEPKAIGSLLRRIIGDNADVEADYSSAFEGICIPVINNSVLGSGALAVVRPGVIY